MEADALLARQIARLRGDSAESRAAADLWDVAELPERLIEFLRKLLAVIWLCNEEITFFWCKSGLDCVLVRAGCGGPVCVGATDAQ